MSANPAGAGVDTPFFSIIIPVREGAHLIAGALASLAGQHCRDFEVVVVDGLSKDETLAVVEAWRSRLPALDVSSQADGGVYPAINRGVARACGQWIHVLGCDDRLASADTLAQVQTVLRATDRDFVYGDVRMLAPNPWVPVGGRYSGAMSLAKLGSDNICQQAVFYRRRLLQAFGPFDARFRVCADWSYAVRAFLGEHEQWMDVVVCDYAATGISASQRDEPFLRELPRMYLQAVLQRPGSARLLPVRWLLHQMAGQAFAQRRRALALGLWLGWAWLSVRARFGSAGV